MIKNQKNNQHGFTIIELAIATTVFSVLLLLSLGAIAQIGKMYYKGVTTAQTQDVSRAVSNEIIQSIQLNAGTVSNTVTPPPGPGGTDSFCVGDTLYSYVIDRPMILNSSTTQHVLWAETLANCASVPHGPLTLTQAVPSVGTGGRELLSSNMRLSKLVVTQVGPASAQLYQVEIGIVYGDDDVLNPNDIPPDHKHTKCTGNFASAQFCAVVNLDTTVKKRI